MVYFSFRSFRRHWRTREQNERSKTSAEREKKFSSSPTTTPLRWRSINPLPSIFYHPRSTDFEEKKKKKVCEQANNDPKWQMLGLIFHIVHFPRNFITCRFFASFHTYIKFHIQWPRFILFSSKMTADPSLRMMNPVSSLIINDVILTSLLLLKC